MKFITVRGASSSTLREKRNYLFILLLLIAIYLTLIYFLVGGFQIGDRYTLGDVIIDKLLFGSLLLFLIRVLVNRWKGRFVLENDGLKVSYTRRNLFRRETSEVPLDSKNLQVVLRVVRRTFEHNGETREYSCMYECLLLSPDKEILLGSSYDLTEITVLSESVADFLNLRRPELTVTSLTVPVTLYRPTKLDIFLIAVSASSFFLLALIHRYAKGLYPSDYPMIFAVMWAMVISFVATLIRFGIVFLTKPLGMDTKRGEVMDFVTSKYVRTYIGIGMLTLPILVVTGIMSYVIHLLVSDNGDLFTDFLRDLLDTIFILIGFSFILWVIAIVPIITSSTKMRLTSDKLREQYFSTQHESSY